MFERFMGSTVNLFQVGFCFVLLGVSIVVLGVGCIVWEAECIRRIISVHRVECAERAYNLHRLLGFGPIMATPKWLSTPEARSERQSTEVVFEAQKCIRIVSETYRMRIPRIRPDNRPFLPEIEMDIPR